MTVMRTAWHLVALIGLCLTLDACEWASSLKRAEPPPAVEVQRHLIEQSNPRFTDTSDKRLDELSDPSVAIMDVPGRPNGGALDDVTLHPAHSASRSIDNPARSAIAPSASGATSGANQSKSIELQFVDTSLRAVIETLFDQYLKKPYSILPDFKDQKVSWIVSGVFSEAEILRMFEAFLDVYSVSITQREGNYFISSSAQRPGAETADLGQATGIWRLEYLDAKEVLLMVRQFATNADRVQVIDASNIIIATGGRTDIRNIDGFIAKIDVSNLEHRHIMIYTPRFVTPQSLAALIENLPKRLGSSLNDPKKPIEAEAVTGQPKVVIVTRGEEMRQAVVEFLKEIDQVGKDRRQVFYYTVKNQKAEDIRTTIDQMLKNIFPETEPGQAVSVIAHVPTNSLIVTASADQFYQIKKMLDRIDFTVPSVLLDAVVAEVSLTDDLAYGVEWFLRGHLGSIGGDISTFTSAIAAGTQTGTIGAFSTTSSTVATLDLLATKTKLNVLSRPRIIVRNKQKATIKSVTEIRLLKSVSNSSVQVSGQTQILNEYETKEVGITLEVTPIIADDGTISLQFSIEDSDQGPQINSQPSFDKRKVDTELIVNNGETIFIGGIIKRQTSDTSNRVPGLGDLPLLDRLFSDVNTSKQSTELVVMVTPHVYADKYAARILTDAFAGSLNTKATDKAEP